MRLPFTREPEQTYVIDRYLWLENRSDGHIILHMPSGDLRLDSGRKLRFRPDVLELPQVKALVESGQISVRQ